AQCFEINGEVQCDPAIVVIDSNGGQQIIWRDNINDPMLITGTGGEKVDPKGTYSYEQHGTSHSYETTWAGPYVALDMAYEINQNNSVDARVELGFPGYASVGDQPYRIDWAHPKSVEDTAGIGSALHLGMGANWKTALTDTIMLSVGLTYDYYSVSGANAKTYLSEKYYMDIYNALLASWTGNGKEESDMLDPADGDPTAINIKNLQSECPGWVCSSDSEIESFYKSMGIRIGVSAKF
ncbi:MAG: hypothetical protein LBF28_01270, partial [Rickettsiales bacterium]|nr:hypothetical protein [Rickettsiales bacterium]